MATADQDLWLKDALGVDVSAYQDGGGDAAAAPTGEAAPSAGGPQPKTEARASFKMVSSNHPTVDVPEDEGASGAAANGSEPSAGGKGGGGAAGEVADKIIAIGEKVVVALANHTGIKDSGKTLSLLPAHVKPNEVRNGATGRAAFSFGLTGGFGNTLADLTFEIDYMVCTVFGNKGRFLKDIRLLVTGSVFIGVSVSVQAAFGEPGNTGPSPKEWVVDLTVDIKTHWNSGFISDGEDTYKLRLNAMTGAQTL